MATSPLFGWEEPDDVDLVKDGAAAMRTLGNAIDTSMGDLLGGTTGQILSKASNTNMDFTWVAPTTGDITGVTAGTGITGGGTSGDVTVSFDQANFGGGQFAAGKNKIINGDFLINQRQFGSGTTSSIFVFDRFRNDCTGGTVTYSVQTFALGTAPVSGYEGKNYLDIASTGQSAAGDISRFNQAIESVRTLAGQTATISFWAKSASGTPKIAVEIQQVFGAGGSPSATVNTYCGQVTTSTSWTRYSVTVSVPSISGKTLGTANDDRLSVNFYTSAGSNFDARTGSLGIQTATISFWGIQVEAGSTATPFQTATGTLQGELAACQRYYYLHLTSASGGKAVGMGYYQSSSQVRVYVSFPVTMRTSPSLVAASGSGYYQVVVNGAADTFNSFTINAAGETGTEIYNGSEVSGTVGQAAVCEATNASSSIAFSAEL